MNEQREKPRDRVLRIATIKFDGGEISCLVRNISTTGAALDVNNSTDVPDFFTLFTDGSHRSCQIMWRRQKRIGVAFN
jgi:PilZ domain